MVDENVEVIRWLYIDEIHKLYCYTAVPVSTDRHPVITANPKIAQPLIIVLEDLGFTEASRLAFEFLTSGA